MRFRGILFSRKESQHVICLEKRLLHDPCSASQFCYTNMRNAPKSQTRFDIYSSHP